MNLSSLVSKYIKHASMSGEEIHGCCPFHDDKKMSFSMNSITGLWICFAECGSGNLLQFWNKLGKSKKELENAGFSNLLTGKLLIDASEIEEKASRLLQNKAMLSKLLQLRGINQETVINRKLGFDGERLWIPIYSEKDCVNIRKYDINKKYLDEYKVISYKKHFGKIRIYPEENLKLKEIILMEGEMDCLLANQLGFNAVTATAGARSFPDEFISLFNKKTVYICYDKDKAGFKGALKLKEKLSKIANVYIINLPVKNNKEDFTDYIVKYKATKQDFLNLMKESKKEVKEENIVPELVQLDKTADSKHYYKHIKFNVVVSGKDLAPYFAPKKIKITCLSGQKKCAYCPVSEQGFLEYEFSDRDISILSLVNCSSDQQKGFIKKKLGITNCHACSIEVLEVMNVETIRVIPEIDFSSVDREYVTREIYSVGNSVYTNKSYQLTGISVPNPKNQCATQIIYDKKPIQDSIEQFSLTPELINKLKIFQPKNESIKEKLADIYKDFTYNITNIYKREDLLMAIDLVFHSVLNFKFMNKPMPRGWTECLIIGDTRSGKTETIKHMINHYKAGELCTGENTSFAGLIGGIQQVQDRWDISWGKIPLNDRRLIVIDEASGLPVEQIAAMSSIRSSGLAEIVKIQTERTHARTRLIWLSNPRSGRRLDSYNYGVLAIRELFGRVEDIARLDFAVTCASSEVDQQEIHRAIQPKVKHTYTSDLCHKLVIWAWAKASDDVIITKEAESEILKQSQEIGKLYSSSIPLVEQAEQRIKLARLSVALAARLFSTKDGKTIEVKKEHVQYVVEFLNQCYTKDSMGYNMYSGTQLKSQSISGEQYTMLRNDFTALLNWRELMDLLLEYQLFRKSDFMDQSGYDTETSKSFLKWCSKNRLIRSTSNGYVKTPIFTLFLKQLLADKNIKENKSKLNY